MNIRGFSLIFGHLLMRDEVPTCHFSGICFLLQLKGLKNTKKPIRITKTIVRTPSLWKGGDSDFQKFQEGGIEKNLEKGGIPGRGDSFKSGGSKICSNFFKFFACNGQKT